MKVKFTDTLVKKYIKKEKSGYYYGDGNGLFLRISKERTGFWVIQPKSASINFLYRQSSLRS